MTEFPCVIAILITVMVAIYAGVALMWLIPDRRLERTIIGQADTSQDSPPG
jgi:hypothetical protein